MRNEPPHIKKGSFFVSPVVYSGGSSGRPWAKDGKENQVHPNGSVPKWQCPQMAVSPNGSVPKWQCPQMAVSPNGSVPKWQCPWVNIRSPKYTQDPSEYTTADAKNDSFGNSSNILISLLETFIILEEYEGLSTKRIRVRPVCVLCSNLRILRGL